MPEFCVNLQVRCESTSLGYILQFINPTKSNVFMKKIFTLVLLAGALCAQAKVYTLASLVEAVGTIENTYEKNGETITEAVGISSTGAGTFTVVLPTGLPDGVDGYTADDDNIVINKSYFTLKEGNDLVVNDGETILFRGAAMIEMTGALTATNARFAPEEGSEATAKGFRLYGNVNAELNNCVFDYVGITFGSDGDGKFIAQDCAFNYHNGKSANATINFSSTGTGNVVKDCTFTDNTLSSIASGANTPVGITVEGCTFNKSITSARLYPAINLSIGGSEDVIVDGNIVTGPAINTRAGGIAVSSLLGGAYTGTVYVRNNEVRDCSYGITLTGPGNIRIEDNKVINNKYIEKATQGGSGINITCNTTGSIAKAYIRGNQIEGNLWGITAVGSVNVNAGKVEDDAADDFNPGENVFVDNGNGGELYDFYNNTANDSYAQGNTWNVAEQTEELIETVVVHKADNDALGKVFFMPPYGVNTAITDVNAATRAAGDNTYYNIMGQPVAHPAAGGIYIHNGSKVIVK